MNTNLSEQRKYTLPEQINVEELDIKAPPSRKLLGVDDSVSYTSSTPQQMKH